MLLKGVWVMDSFGLPMEGYVFSEMPIGFGLELMTEEMAVNNGFNGLSESQKEEVINRCKDAKSTDEMHKIVDNYIPDGNMNSLFEGPASK